MDWQVFEHYLVAALAIALVVGAVRAYWSMKDRKRLDDETEIEIGELEDRLAGEIGATNLLREEIGSLKTALNERRGHTAEMPTVTAPTKTKLRASKPQA